MEQKKSSTLVHRFLAGLTALCALLPVCTFGQQTGSVIVSGQISITTPNAGNTIITQSSSKGLIEWQDFSIPAGATVSFVQPSSSAITLNRVVGPNASTINGALISNGQVWVINPNGVLFGNGSTTNIGGLIATTSDITSQNFATGNYDFNIPSAGTAIVNKGVIRSAGGGSVVLSATHVANEGLIEAKGGMAVLGGTNAFTVDFNGDKLLSYAVTPQVQTTSNTTANIASSVSNSGAIRAAGGKVLMTARAAGNVMDSVINNTGIVEATSVSERNGEIILDAGPDGTINNDGALDASGKDTGQTGGNISLTGNTVAVDDGAQIDASGDAGGGNIAVSATNASVKGRLDASATGASGAGGKINVISTGDTNVTATLRARPGISNGVGGKIETSGSTLSVEGANVDAGLGGQWLLDPYDLTIDSGAATTINGSLNAGTNVTLQTTASGSTGPGIANAAGNGDITLQSPISWSTTATLFVSAYRNIAVKANITITGAGTLAVEAGTGSGGSTPQNYIFGKNGSISFGAVDHGAVLTTDGVTRVLLYNMGALQNINSNLNGIYALATSLNAATDPTTPATWIPIGTDGLGNVLNGGLGFNGAFTGLGNTISNLVVNTTTHNDAGLFGYSSDTIRDIGLIGGSVSGAGNVGALLGFNNGGDVIDVYATSTVAGTGSAVGGLVGSNSGGSITVSFATGAVSAANGSAFVGGLVGITSGSISNTYATGAVSGGSGGGNNYFGGLVGFNNGATIVKSYATGTVSGSSNVGGLVGINNSGTIAQDWATGAVTGTQSGNNIGGLVGYNHATLVNSYAMGAVTGIGQNIGGLAGLNDSNIATVYATGAVSGGTNVHGLIGSSTAGSIVSSYWDTQTSGQSTGVGTGQTTAQLQGSLPSGFNNTIWGTGTGLYPYFLWQYSTGTPQSISGFAYSDRGVSPLASSPTSAITVSSLVDGKSLASATTGANGYFYMVSAPGTFTGSQQVLTYLNNSSVQANNFVQAPSAPMTNDLYGGYLRIFSANSFASGIFSGISTALGSNTGSNFLYAGGNLVPNTSVEIVSSNAGGLAIDSAINTGTGTLRLNATGPITQTVALTAQNLELLGAGASYSLQATANSIGTLAANTGAVSVTDSTSLSTGTVNATTGVTSSGAVTLRVTGDLTIAAGANVTAGGGSDVALAATANFLNNSGSSAVNVSGGARWLIYSNVQGGDVFNNLDSANTPVWAQTYATLAPSGVTQTGNRYIFNFRPPLSFTTTSLTKTYGSDVTASVSTSYTVSGYQAGVTNAFLGDSAANVYSGTPSVTSLGSPGTAGVSGSPYGITATTGSLIALNGYAFGFVGPGLLTVNRAALTVTANSQTKTYGTNDPTLTFATSAFQNGENAATALTGSLSRASFGTLGGEQVGSYAINQGSLAANNYTITFTGNNLSIGAATVNVSANALNKAYGTNDPTLGFGTSGLVSGTIDGVAINDTAGSVLTGNLARASFGTLGGEQVGSYAISQGSLAANSNYTIAFTGNNLSIGAATLNVSANAANKTYGTNDPTLNFGATGLVSGTIDGVAINDTAGSVLTGNLSRAGFGTLGGEQVGSYTITQGSLTANSNYTIAFTVNNLSIGKATVNVSANAANKTYGINDPTLGFGTGGLFSGTVDGVAINDTAGSVLTGNLSRANFGILAGEQVGLYAINQGNLAANGNYTLAFTGNNLTIGAATLAVSANAASKTYGTNDPTLGFSVTSGLVSGTVDGVTITDTSSVLSGSLSRASFGTLGGEQVGSYAIGQGSLAANNYTITFTGNNLNIGTATVNVSANALNKTYGTNDPTLGFGTSGMVSGTIDGVAISDTAGSVLTGNLARASFGTLGGEQVGSYAISQGSLAANSNYTIAFTGNNLGISTATVNVSANATSKTYGTNDPTLNFGTTGLVSGTVDGVAINDTAGSVLAGNLARASFGTLAGEQVGSYAITRGSLASNSNYTVSFTGNNLTINAAILAVSANVANKTYGTNDPTLGFGVTSGLVSGTVDGVTITDTSSVLSGSLSRASFGTLGGEQVGSHAINQGSLAASNYTVAFTGNNLSIGTATVTVSANAANKTYGTNDPTLGFGTSGLVSGTIDGVVVTDTAGSVLTGNLARASFGTLGGEQAGSYAIGRGSLAANGNYTVSFTGNNLVIGAATLTVSAIAQNKTYGINDPTLSYGVTSGLVSGTVDGVAINDTAGSVLTGNLSRASFGTLPGEQVGTYAISQGSLAATGNYTVSFTGSNLAIGSATLAVSANTQNKTYGTNDPTLSYSVTSGLVSATVDGVAINDTAGSVLTGTLVRANSGTLGGEQVGSYAITRGSLAANSNYTVSFTGNNLTINAAILAVSANAASKTYGANDPTLGYGITGGLVSGTVDGVTITDTSSVLSGILSRANFGTLTGEQVGNYAINQGNLAANNYTIAFTGNNLAIGTATLAVSANAAIKIYGTNDPTLGFGTAGLVSGTVDGVTITDTTGSVLTGNLSRASFGTLPGEQVGTFAIGRGGLTANSNYTIAFTGNNLTIGAATLGVSATAANKTYGTNDPTLSFGTTGLVSGTVDGVTITDTAGTVLTGNLSRTSFGTLAGEQVGTFAIGRGGLTANSNYTINFTSSNLTINAATLSITATAANKTYGTNDPILGFTASGLVSGIVDGVTITDTAGSALTGSLSRANFGTLAGEQVGTYAISRGSLVAGNYNIVFTGNNLTIGTATVNVSANAANKTYGTNDPTLSYSVTGGLVSGTVDGVTISDTAGSALTGSLSRANFGTLAGEQVGAYAISRGSLVAGNYTIVFTGNNLTIGAATLSVSANAANKISGMNDPTLGYSSSGLVSRTVDGVTIADTAGLVLTGSLDRAGGGTPAGEQAGVYAIGQGSLVANSDYTIVFTGNNLTIGAATIVPTVTVQQAISVVVAQIVSMAPSPITNVINLNNVVQVNPPPPSDTSTSTGTIADSTTTTTTTTTTAAAAPSSQVTNVTVTSPPAGNANPTATTISLSSSSPNPIAALTAETGPSTSAETPTSSDSASAALTNSFNGSTKQPTTRLVIPGVLRQDTNTNVKNNNAGGVPSANQGFSSWGNEALWQ